MHPIESKLNKISPSFCAAKWLQVTVRLQNGQTHSCHHPKAHNIPKRALKRSVSALHNTPQKKKARKAMLSGERPSECFYCWNVEDLKNNQLSDRFIKSADPWAEPFIDEIAELPWDADVHPKYLEVSFSNTCNFKCAYCFPDVSSKIMSEIRQHGPYPTRNYFGSIAYLKKEGTLPLPPDKNIYLDAFWKWIPEVLGHLHVLRVTGGEPLLSKDLWKLLDFLENNPSPNLSLAINTNLGVPSALVEKVVSKLNSLESEGKIKEARIFTSIDTWGEQAEYIRHGLKMELWQKNLSLCLDASPRIKCTIMVAFNMLSVFRFRELLQFVLSQRQIYKIAPELDISMVHHPDYLSILVLSEKDKARIERDYQFVLENSHDRVAGGFFDQEIAKMRRIAEYARTSLSAEARRWRRMDFSSYFLEYDRRKKTNFPETFPEMAEEFEDWKLLEQQTYLRSIKKKLIWMAHKYSGKLF